MRTTEQLFSEKVRVDAETGCWIWTASLGRGGYGRFWDGEKKVYAHRFSWELHRGPIPDGMQLDHYLMNAPEARDRCSRACCNPDHLEIVTHGENLRRSAVHAENGRRNGRRNGIAGRKHDLPEGVTPSRKRFRARIRSSAAKRMVDLGTFDTPIEAHKRYLIAKRTMR